MQTTLTKMTLVTAIFTAIVSPFGFGATTTAPDTSSVIHLEKAKSELEFLAVGNPSAIKIRGKIED